MLLWLGGLTLRRLHRFDVGSCLLRQATHRRFTHLHSSQALQHLGRAGKWYPGDQMNQMFVLLGVKLPGNNPHTS